MAIVAVYENPEMTAEQYDQIVAALRSVGKRKPDGRQFLVAASADGSWLVVDVWDSEDEFNAFGETLTPILDEAGVDQPPPRIYQVHDIIS